MPFQKDWFFMKLRKSLAAVATALAVATAGTTVAVAQEKSSFSSNSTPAANNNAAEEKKDEAVNDQGSGDDKGKQTDKESSENGSSIKDAKAEDIKSWISVFTAVITALGTLFAFVQKYL